MKEKTTLTDFLRVNNCHAMPKEFVKFWDGEHSYRTLCNWVESKPNTLRALIVEFLKKNRRFKG